MNDSHPDRPLLRSPWLLLAGFCALLLLLALYRPLAVSDEGRYAEVGRWMLQSGDWLTPRLNGIPFFHKPPYLYWLEAISMAALGQHVWAARLVIALHAALMLLGLYFGARRLWGEAVAQRATWMLGTSLAFLVGGQYVNHDMLVAAWISAAIWCLGLAFMLGGQAPDKCWARWGMVCCAFGFLSKGLIGLVLPGGVIFFWLLATNQWRKMLRFPWLSGFALFALIALPWFVLVEREHPGVFSYMFGHHQVSRFGGTTFNNVRPWWFYGVCLLVLMCPWTFFALRTAWGDAKGGLLRGGDVAQQARLLCWIWLLLILVFFSIPSSKIIGYVLPVMPALAVLSALGWAQTVGSRRWQGAALVAVGVLAMGFGVVATVMSARYTERKDGSRDVAMKLACLAAPQDKVFALGEFPYDAPFYTRAQSAMRVIQDWDSLRKNSGDNWRRELFEGADFDAAAGAVLQTEAQLNAAAAEPGNWALVKDASAQAQALSGWTLVFKGQAWSLYRSGSGAESPKTAEHKGLNRCQD